eukprot:TRINITY_DN33092_c0_g1_i1.p1 TRINITY_DN33092_c0_g1~~TRINITY_DN33092_c0_g1_i1.p1  ORF type:complete len:452 (+),score=113.21 TRINITY_DN33092_c0_g1_i1:56-1357(+)
MGLAYGQCAAVAAVVAAAVVSFGSVSASVGLAKRVAVLESRVRASGPQLSTAQPSPAPPTATAVPTASLSSEPTANASVVLVSYYHSPPLSPGVPFYVASTFVWNALYTYRHPGHAFMFYVPPQGEGPVSAPTNPELPSHCSMAGKPRTSVCRGPGGCHLHPSWCKLKAVAAAAAAHRSAEWILWLDSDAVVGAAMKSVSVPAFVASAEPHMGEFRGPVFATLATPGWWCDLRLRRADVRVRRKGAKNYPHCLNAGVFLAKASREGLRALDVWWNSSLDDYALAPVQLPFRQDWPWEQDRLHAMVSGESGGVADKFQVTPTQEYRLPDQDTWAARRKPCLASLPAYHCFVEHWCYDNMTKAQVGHLYRDQALGVLFQCWKEGRRCPVERSAVDIPHLLLTIVLNGTALPHDWRAAVLHDVARVLLPRHVHVID